MPSKTTIALSSLVPAIGVLLLIVARPYPPQGTKPPNVVIIFYDDAGWADFEPFDKAVDYTPHTAKLAENGFVLSNYAVPQAICSASRAALLTGCYPGRTGVFSAHAPQRPALGREFSTFGEIFKSAGYHTALFGKWHLGDVDGQRPWDRGFDETAGILYSADMWAGHPEAPEYWGQFPLQFFENGRVIIDSVTAQDQTSFTERYTNYATDFIRRKAAAEAPFLLYIPHNQPHVPLFVGERFQDTTGRGLYADVIAELDWSVGQIRQSLEDQGALENTIFIVTSDNGPWLSYGNHAGRTPFREGKGTSWEGGVKTGMVLHYPSLGAGRYLNNTVFSIDLLPTLVELTGISASGLKVDGQSFAGLLHNPEKWDNPHAYYPISNQRQLQAIVSGDGRFKLHVKHPYRTLAAAGGDGIPGKYRQDSTGVELYDLFSDPFEREEVNERFPEVEATLMNYYQAHYQQFYKSRE